jgi:hypothetical protein
MGHGMQKKNALALIALALLVGACGTTPKNAQEFRQATLDGQRAGLSWMGVAVETFEVERPFRDVSSTLQKKADECLKIATRWTATNSYGNTRSGVRTYKPTFVASSSKAELHVQFKREGGGEIDLGSPPDGFYRAVLDATPLPKNRTKIEIYSQSKDTDLLRKAMRGWVRGDNLGCPDLR